MALFLTRFRKALREGVLSAATEGARAIKRRVTENLSGKVLKSRTGRGRNSTSARAEETSGGALIIISNAIHYLRFWEFGIKAHFRGRQTILTLRSASGRSITAKSKRKQIKAQVARPWMWPAVGASMPEIRRQAADAVSVKLHGAASKMNMKVKI